MKNVLLAIFGVIIGVFIGGTVNMGIIMLSDSIIPLPAGVDGSDMNSLAAGMHLFEPKNFIMPFLAHALGTFAGAFIAGFVARKYKLQVGLTVGGIFLFGGISMAISLPAPMWFNVTDIVFAYLPMGWLASRMIKKKA